MDNLGILTYGNIPVPYTVAWTDEEHLFVGKCITSPVKAICQVHSRGIGKPIFGKPHMNRQRETIDADCCDLCGKPLKGRTKISLSDARPQIHANRPFEILQVEPLLHKECAATSIKYCPHLQTQLESGEIKIRQVTQYTKQVAVLKDDAVEEFTGERIRAIGHAKVCLKRWKDRDLAWLLKGVMNA